MKQICLWILAVMLSLPVYAQQHKTKAGNTKKTTTQQHRQARTVSQDEETPPTVAPPAPPKKIYETTDIEKMPEFAGGYAALHQYLGSNLNYPNRALEADIQGKVIVSFTVCEDGSLCDEKIVKRLGGGCEEEALRVIRKMPRWQPGQKDGKPVKVRFMLPIVFHLAD